MCREGLQKLGGHPVAGCQPSKPDVRVQPAEHSCSCCEARGAINWPTSGPFTILGSLPLSILPICRAIRVLPVPA